MIENELDSVVKSKPHLRFDHNILFNVDRQNPFRSTAEGGERGIKNYIPLTGVRSSEQTNLGSKKELGTNHRTGHCFLKTDRKQVQCEGAQGDQEAFFMLQTRTP